MIRDTWSKCKDFQYVLETIAKRMFDGEEVSPLSWFTTSRLIPLRKHQSNKIRPIACGEAFTRLAARWALTAVNAEGALLKCQFGVGTKGGVEPLIWGLYDDLAQHKEGGVVAIDFVNAFNTIFRHVMANSIREHVPQHWRIAKKLNGAPSTLFVSHDGETHTVPSRTGIRQGDVFGPLFFSLAIRPMLEKIQEHHPLRAYADDVQVQVNDQDAKEKLLTMLEDMPPEIKAGLQVNPSKTWFATFDDIRREGREILGSFVGGDGRGAQELMMKAVTELDKRVQGTADLCSLQHRLLLLRFCFFPCFSHFLRTISPDVTLLPARAYDDTVWRCLTNWFGDLPDHSRLIAQLPTRFAGLGLFSQERIAGVCYGASFIQSYGILNRRDMTVGNGLIEKTRTWFTMCTDNLNLPSSQDPLGESTLSTLALQKKALERVHELHWLNAFSELDRPKQERLLEGTGPIARGWLHAIPSYALRTLNNQQVTYGVRRTLLADLSQSKPQTANCPMCQQRWTDGHHLVCRHTSSERTSRHHSVRRAVAESLKQFADVVSQELPIGPMRHDILTVRSEGSSRYTFIDVTVPSLQSTRNGARMPWPTDEEVSKCIEHQTADRAKRFQERNLDPPHRLHPDIEKARTFRQMSWARSVGGLLADSEANKRAYFEKNFVAPPDCTTPIFHPFVLTAGGAQGPTTIKVYELLRHKAAPDDVEEAKKDETIQLQITLGVILLRYAANMAKVIGESA